MVHMPPAEWHDGDERAVDGKAERVGQARQDDFFRGALPQHREAREIGFGIGPHRLVDELRGFLLAFGQLYRPNPRGAIG
jgi:hypothetical protein